MVSWSDLPRSLRVRCRGLFSAKQTARAITESGVYTDFLRTQCGGPYHVPHRHNQLSLGSMFTPKRTEWNDRAAGKWRRAKIKIMKRQQKKNQLADHKGEPDLWSLGERAKWHQDKSLPTKTWSSLWAKLTKPNYVNKIIKTCTCLYSVIYM